MKFTTLLKREVEVAFSKHAQPIWLRILKYILLLSFIYFFHDSHSFWIILAIVLVMGLMLHFFYRYKTNGWTKSYGGWDYKKNISKLNDD
ncbi:MAG: hypothetical protein ABI772_09260 [Bacteroidota bacterium]